ncbi:SC6A3-like protein [Mya arenaria]|uniref:SC6A3-like protein n=1 Tax=Mya arenaria TaxID=6604 RepID=A0ABY7EGR7_MYAAR|nr:SC6A3-like protein [Mya arenaria]
MNAAGTKLKLQESNGMDINTVEIGAGCRNADDNHDVALDVTVSNVSATNNGEYASGSNDSTGPEEERETWSGQFEFLLSVVGYTVGLGNIWRFPYFVKRNGGGVALIPFLIFLVTCGGPLYYIEVCLAQFSGKSPIKVWDICPLFRGIGFVMVGLSFMFAWYFGACFSWIIYYLIHSFHPSLAWASCGQPWNTEFCIGILTFFSNSFRHIVACSISLYRSNTLKSFILNLSDRSIAIVLAVEAAEVKFAFSAYSFGLFRRNNVLAKSRGINDLGSVQLHLLGCMALGWLLVFLCLWKGCVRDGDIALRIADCAPDSRRHFGRDTMIVCFADGFTGFFGGLVVFSVLGFLAKETGVSIDDLPFSGASLAFIAYPEALSRLPLPNLWAVLFFITLILVGIDTTGGYYIFMLTDWYIATFNIVFVALLETIIISWIYGANRFSEDIEMMTGNRPPLLVRIFWSVIIPIFISTILITSAINFGEPSFGKGGYQYPDYAVVLGDVLAFAPLISVFAVAAILVAIKGTGTITQRICQLTRPSKGWRPNDEKAEQIFNSKSYTYRETLLERIIYDVLGWRSSS